MRRGRAARRPGKHRVTRKEAIMANDPVCGMKLDEKKAAARVDYRDKTYYFCSTQCRQAFTAAPGKYVNAGASGPARGGDGTRQHS